MYPGKYVLLILALVLAVANSAGSVGRTGDSYPNVPSPICRQPVLVTAAGMGAEGVIMARMCDQLNLDYIYLAQAGYRDLPGMGSVVIVVGASPAGMRNADTTAAAEEERVMAIADHAAAMHIPVMVVHLGGRGRRDALDDRFIRDLVPKASYVVVAGSGNYDGLFTRLTRTRHIPLTEVSGIDEVEVPLNSAFR